MWGHFKTKINVTPTPKSENYKKLRKFLNLCFNGSEMQYQHFYVGYNQQCERCYSIGALYDAVKQLYKGRTISFLGGGANFFRGKIVCFKFLTNHIVCFSNPMEKIP